jgi:hypothetical protein
VENEDVTERRVAPSALDCASLPDHALGVDAGQFVVPDDFDDPLPGWFTRYFR